MLMIALQGPCGEEGKDSGRSQLTPPWLRSLTVKSWAPGIWVQGLDPIPGLPAKAERTVQGDPGHFAFRAVETKGGR